MNVDSRLTGEILGRASRPVLTEDTRAALAGRSVLITGAGGSIGSELARQVAACGPALLTLMDQSEYHLFQVEAEVRRQWPGLRLHVVLGDVTRAADVAEAFDCTPDLVLHAAAYKHVTMVERAIVAAARVNVLGTAMVLEAARRVGCRMVLVSSDKAAEPASVMGATKRMAEMVVLASGGAGERAVVRFGNVLGSSGSVLELMVRAIDQGAPIPVTDPSATRYFMTVGEAVSLVLTAGCGPHQSDVFWVDMGEPIRIGELADRVARWARAQGRAAVGTRVIGLRDGEKLDEQLTTQGLEMTPTDNPHVWAARQAPIDVTGLVAAMAQLSVAVESGDIAGVLEALVDGVPDFIPAAATCARVLPSQFALPEAA